eukprot:s6639_g1.t3
MLPPPAREPCRTHGGASLLSVPSRASSASPAGSFSSAVGSWISSMPALHRLTSQETYYCQICLNNCPSTDGFPLSACGHTFCRDCIKGYVELKVQEAAVRSLLCPFLPSALGGGEPPSAGLDSGCAREVADADVEALGGEALLEKLRRFRAMRQDETYRECPQCATQVPGGSARTPSMTCSQCGLTFCFVHSNAHPGQLQALSLVSLHGESGHYTLSKVMPAVRIFPAPPYPPRDPCCGTCGAHLPWLRSTHRQGRRLQPHDVRLLPGKLLLALWSADAWHPDFSQKLGATGNEK